MEGFLLFTNIILYSNILFGGKNMRIQLIEGYEYEQINDTIYLYRKRDHILIGKIENNAIYKSNLYIHEEDYQAMVNFKYLMPPKTK